MAQQILHIAVATPLRKVFDYLPADSHPSPNLQPGMRVLLPWRNHTMIGIILRVDHHSELSLDKLRQIIEVLDDEPVLDQKLLNLGQWASQYYQHPIGDVLFNMLPTLLRKDTSVVETEEFMWQVKREQHMPDFGRAKKQLELYNYLLDYPKGCSTEQLIKYGFSHRVIGALAEKQLLQKTKIVSHYSHQAKNEGPALNQEQSEAIHNILKKLHCFTVSMLDGVTGSGKTEVYLQCITKVLAQEKQVLILVPEIGLTPQTLARFQQRFDTDIAVLHSNLTDKQRYFNWRKAQRGQAKLLIGTRSAVFATMPQLALIIIDESHDSSFKQQDSFRYSARDLAIMRAKSNNIPIILGSATPSFESLCNIQRGRFQHLRLTQRAGNAKAPTYQLVDIRQKVLYAGLSPTVVDVIKQHLQQSAQVLLFLNRRGFAPTLMCHDCGWLAECKHCDARLTLHLSPRHLHCHHCDHAQRVVSSCPTCQGTNIIPIGLGTERIEQQLAELFPEYSTCRIDRDSTAKRGALNNMLNDIHSGKQQILLGTQMLAKGHHFPKVTLVVIIDADSGFFSADFRSGERMAQLLIQVAGRAGRAEQPGHVMIQTRNPDHPSLQSLLAKGYHHFAEQALQERQLALLPPFSYQALMRADSTNPEAAQQFLTRVKQQMPDKTISVLGPIAAPMSKRAGRFRSQLLFQADNRSQLQQYLAQLVDKVDALKSKSSLRWSLDIDPIDTY